MSGERYDVVSLPRVCLALYSDGELTTLAPTRSNSGVLSPMDALERLALERTPPTNAT
jgi:hypothetical protein